MRMLGRQRFESSARVPLQEGSVLTQTCTLRCSRSFVQLAGLWGIYVLTCQCCLLCFAASAVCGLGAERRSFSPKLRPTCE